VTSVSTLTLHRTHQYRETSLYSNFQHLQITTQTFESGMVSGTSKMVFGIS